MTPHGWEVLYIAGLMTCAVAVLVTTVIDIARRPPGRRMGEAWGNPSAFRIAAFIGFFALLLLDLVWPISGR